MSDTPCIENQLLAELLYANSHFHEGDPNPTAQLMRDGAERIRQLESEVNNAKLGEEAMLICIQTTCEVLGEQVQPAFLPDLVRECLAAKTAECERLREDAERYRWLRGRINDHPSWPALEHLDSAIDAARKETP